MAKGDRMTLQDFVERARASGRVFAVQFVKRTDGTLREMVCRTGVEKGTHGGSMGYDPADHGLLSVHVMGTDERDPRKRYRSIPVDAIRRLTMEGHTYEAHGLELVEVES